jgi:hypothetical protein
MALFDDLIFLESMIKLRFGYTHDETPQIRLRVDIIEMSSRDQKHLVYLLVQHSPVISVFNKWLEVSSQLLYFILSLLQALLLLVFTGEMKKS